jgi:hypothetical protein
MTAAAGLALAAAAGAAWLGAWAAALAGLAAAVAAVTCLRAAQWTRTVIRRLQRPGTPQTFLGQVCARPSALDPSRAGQRYLDLLALTPALRPGPRIQARIPLIGGQRPPDGWQQGDPVTVLGRPRPGRVVIAVAAGTVLVPAGRARPALRRHSLITIRPASLAPRSRSCGRGRQ